MICKNCKYHYIEEISFDYPQSCCSKREATTEEWCKCNDFEYSNGYIEQLQQENKKLKEQLLVAQANEEIFRLEMKDITRALGLAEDILFDDVKANARSLKDNWNMLKEYINEANKDLYWTNTYDDILDKMQELEQGSDSNE